MDVLGIFCGFWLVVFSRIYREIWLWEFERANIVFKCIHILESIIAVLFGLGIPIAIIYYCFYGG